MNKIILWLLSPIWIFLAITDYANYENLIKYLKLRYIDFKGFPENYEVEKEGVK